ncbi:hypothetical protein PSHT_05028, partial [Puccinia striiformis]
DWIAIPAQSNLCGITYGQEVDQTRSDRQDESLAFCSFLILLTTLLINDAISPRIPWKSSTSRSNNIVTDMVEVPLAQNQPAWGTTLANGHGACPVEIRGSHFTATFFYRADHPDWHVRIPSGNAVTMKIRYQVVDEGNNRRTVEVDYRNQSGNNPVHLAIPKSKNLHIDFISCE